MYALTAFLIIGSTVSGSTISRIVGGHDAKENSYPYQVSIRKVNFPRCGGSIINHYFILTAAHCIYRQLSSEITVVAGATRLTESGIAYAADMLIWHEDFNQTLIYNDIGLIRVNKHIDFNDKVQPIPLASVYYVPPRTTAVVTGWGRQSYDSPELLDTLQVLNVSVILQEICQAIYWQATKNNICTFTKKDEGVCSGDSGGPLVINGTQVGIVSYGRPCAIGYPDVYTRVFPYRSWITNVTNTWNTGSGMNSNACISLLLSVLTVMSYVHSLS